MDGPSRVALSCLCCLAVAHSLAAPALKPNSKVIVRQAEAREDWQAASLLNTVFGGATLFYLGSLRVPSLNSNVFFKPVADPIIAVALLSEDAGEICAVAQLIRAELRPAIGVPNTGKKPVSYIQSVAVADSARRQGVARTLMRWCEATALTTWTGNERTDEAWLAVGEENEAAISLYDSLGYVRRNVAFNNVLMSRRLDAASTDGQVEGSDATGDRGNAGRSSTIRACAAAEEDDPAEAPSAATRLPGGGVGLAPLATNLGVQALYAGVAIFGIALLLGPFGGPTPAALVGFAEPWGGDCAAWAGQQCDAAAEPAAGAATVVGLARAVAECTLGLGVAWLELSRLGVHNFGMSWPMSKDPRGGREGASRAAASEQLAYGPAQAEQMRPLYQIAAGEARLPIAAAAIVVWQLAIAVAEELYYRGFVESAGVLAFSPLSSLGMAGTSVREALPLVVSAALFGLVHTEFVQELPPGEEAPIGTQGLPPEETKARWFRVAAAYGALYSLLYVLSGHRLLAPACAHAGLNVGQCLQDWAKMRVTPEDELQRIFEEK